MQPVSVKCVKVENTLPIVDFQKINPSVSISTLSDGIIIYVGRLIVKSPVLHLFLPASRKLAQCALKVFADFANEGGALSFYSSDPDKVVRFALANGLSTLNLSNLTVTAPHLDDLLGGNSSVTKLYAPYPSWTERAHSALSKLIALSVKNYASAEVLELENNRPWNNLTRLELCATRVYGQKVSLPQLARMPKLKELKLTYVALPNDLPLQLARLPDLATLSLVYCSDGNDSAENVVDQPYLQFAQAAAGLTSLSLTRNSSIAWNFCKALPVLTNLQVLRLERCNEDDTDDAFDGESRILECVRRFAQLKTLSLVEFQFDEQIIEALSIATGLQNLTLSILGSNWDAKSAFDKIPEKKDLFSKIENLITLESLDLSRQKLSIAHFQSIGRLTNLRSLSLRELHTISSEKINTLTNLTNLTSLDLRYSLRSGLQDEFIPLLRMPKLRKVKVTQTDAISTLSKHHVPYLQTLMLTDDIFVRSLCSFDEESIVAHLATLPELRTLYSSSLHSCFASIQLLANKVTQLQKLAIPSLSDTDSLQEITQWLKSKQIRFVCDEALGIDKLEPGM